MLELYFSSGMVRGILELPFLPWKYRYVFISGSSFLMNWIEPFNTRFKFYPYMEYLFFFFRRKYTLWWVIRPKQYLLHLLLSYSWDNVENSSSSYRISFWGTSCCNSWYHSVYRWYILLLLRFLFCKKILHMLEWLCLILGWANKFWERQIQENYPASIS